MIAAREMSPRYCRWTRTGMFAQRRVVFPRSAVVLAVLIITVSAMTVLTFWPSCDVMAFATRIS